MSNSQPNETMPEKSGSSVTGAQPVAWLRDAHEGQGDECLVPAAKGDPGAFPVYAEPAAADLLHAAKAAADFMEHQWFGRKLYATLQAAIQRAEGGK